MEEIGDCIQIGYCGGEEGEHFSFKAKAGGITEIIIRDGEVIDSISFKSCSDSNNYEYSAAYGEKGNNKNQKTNKILLDWPREYLTGIRGTFGPYASYHYPRVVIHSLCFHTNRTQYGPYGMNNGTPFTFHMVEGGEIVGFKGRYWDFVDAIGLYVKPRASVCSPTPSDTKNVKLIDMASKMVPKCPGPWGNIGGMPWDDGVFSEIKEVRVSLRNSIAVQFLYLSKEDKLTWSARHGGPSEDKVYRIKLDSSGEYIVGLQGFYDCAEGNEVIKSLTFNTTKGKYGPFGDEVGQGFSTTLVRGRIVGFFGRGGKYLDSIGVHMEYF